MSDTVETAPRRCAIIGAGSSGLVSAKWAVEYGLEPVIFERDHELGGLWRYKSEETEYSTVMRSTVINSSKEMSSFSDFPPNPKLSCYMHNEDLLQYFRDYATHYDLRKYIRYRHEVRSIRRAADYERTGEWTIAYVDLRAGDSTDFETAPKVKEETFACVLLCIGHHTTPSYPSKMWPGTDQFQGKFKHSHSYKDHVGYEGKTVVVVGAGNSALDIAVELSHITRRVHLSTRRGAWVLPRVGKYGYPQDMWKLTRFNVMLPSSLAKWAWKREVRNYFDHDKFGLKPNHDIFAQHVTVNDEIANRIVSGTLVVKPDIREFCAPRTVIFTDGTRLENVDEVILCTGYAFDFRLVEDGTLIPVHNNEVSLYKYMFSPELVDHNTLAVIGLIQPIGSILPIAEMQVRVFFEQLTGQIQLPTADQMLVDIERKRTENRLRYTASTRHTIQVDYIAYMDELADMIGARPSVARIALTDPALAYCLLFEANVPYIYRLVGPRPWSGARAAVMSARNRAENAQRTRVTSPESGAGSGASNFLVCALAVLIALYLIMYM